MSLGTFMREFMIICHSVSTFFGHHKGEDFQAWPPDVLTTSSNTPRETMMDLDRDSAVLGALGAVFYSSKVVLPFILNTS